MYSSNITAIQALVKKRITPDIEKHLRSISAEFDSNRLHVRAVVRDGLDQVSDSKLEAMATAIRDDLNYVFSDKWIVHVEMIPNSSDEDQQPLEIKIH